MQLELDTDGFATDIIKLERQQVTVGIWNTKGNRNIKMAVADHKSARKNWNGKLRSRSKAVADRTPSDKKKAKIEIGFIAKIFDKKYGIFSKALEQTDQRDLINITNLFAKMEKSPADIRRLVNAGQAVVRKPMFEKRYGSNAESTSKRKRFDHLFVDTGRLMNNIRAKYNGN